MPREVLNLDSVDVILTGLQLRDGDVMLCGIELVVLGYRDGMNDIFLTKHF